MGMKPRKTKIFLTDDMKRKVAREYGTAAMRDKIKIRRKYNVSASAICRWINEFGTEGVPNGNGNGRRRRESQTPLGTVLKLVESGALKADDAETLIGAINK